MLKFRSRYKYPQLIGNAFKWGNFTLDNVDEIFTCDLALIARKGDYYNIYFPKYIDSRTLETGKLFCVFENVKEYVFVPGALFVKEGDNETGNWIVININAFTMTLHQHLKF